jgi:hypothetical protein
MSNSPTVSTARQFVTANERPAPYDYFMLVGGPFSLALRAAMPEDVTEAVGHHRSSRQQGVGPPSQARHDQTASVTVTLPCESFILEAQCGQLAGHGRTRAVQERRGHSLLR